MKRWLFTLLLVLVVFAIAGCVRKQASPQQSSAGQDAIMSDGEIDQIMQEMDELDNMTADMEDFDFDLGLG